MAVITQTTFNGVTTPVTITRTSLSASDTLTYTSGGNQVLVLYNTTASPVTVTITGSTATTISPAGYGATVSVASGIAIVVPASGTKAVCLDKISAYLSGNITVTGGVGVDAHLMG